METNYVCYCLRKNIMFVRIRHLFNPMAPSKEMLDAIIFRRDFKSQDRRQNAREMKCQKHVHLYSNAIQPKPPKSNTIRQRNTIFYKSIHIQHTLLISHVQKKGTQVSSYFSVGVLNTIFQGSSYPSKK